MKTTCLIVLLCIGSTFADPKNTRPVKTRTTPSVVTSVANECKTTNGVACTFPFMYSGVTYQTCTSAQNNGVDWCATSLHETGEAKNYGNCASNCPGDTNVVTTQKPSDNCETTDNIQCVFPFLYSGASYSHCTTQDNFGVNWCATSLHGSGEAKDYGTCKSDCPVKAAQVTTTAFDSCNTKDEIACVFPFVYAGVTYTTCTSKDWPGTNWCATTRYTETNEAKDYGVCKSDCKGEDQAVNNKECKTNEDVTCKFPFIYSGVSYNSCTAVDNGGVKWCATTLYPSNEAKDYGNCGANC